ncbi:hypothetical protein D6T65_05070 [Arthrobacter frigidicola]|nr:hypothetical protein D6T65_05070 [Arthrobacter frigidicola]
MTRSRASAKAAGASFERLVADAFVAGGFRFADRRVKTGAKDTGDVGGVHLGEHRVVVEAKDYGGRLEPSTWLREAAVEAENDGALLGVVVAKRRGTRAPEDQYVLMTLGDLIALLKQGNTSRLP